MSRFIVMTSTAAAPRGRRSVYRNVALCEVEDGAIPKMISERAKGVVRIVRRWPPQYVGRTQNCAFRRTLAAAEAEVARMNKERAS